MKELGSYLQNLTPPSTGFSFGRMKDDPGDGSGTGITSDTHNDIWYALAAMIKKYRPEGLSDEDESEEASDLVEAVEACVATFYDTYCPVGTIRMFSGAFINNVTIPGWYICDGSNGTPDLVNRFVRGGLSSGATGGSDSKVLQIANLPAHNHTVALGSHNHDLPLYEGSGSTLRYGPFNVERGSEKVKTDSKDLGTKTTSSVGSGTGFDVKPAYYTLIFIMRVA